MHWCWEIAWLRPSTGTEGVRVRPFGETRSCRIWWVLGRAICLVLLFFTAHGHLSPLGFALGGGGGVREQLWATAPDCCCRNTHEGQQWTSLLLRPVARPALGQPHGAGPRAKLTRRSGDTEVSAALLSLSGGTVASLFGVSDEAFGEVGVGVEFLSVAGATCRPWRRDQALGWTGFLPTFSQQDFRQHAVTVGPRALTSRSIVT